MTFSDWSKKRKNRQVDLQETTPEPQTTAKATAQPTQKQTAAPSFEEWTRTQQDKQRQTELRSAWSDKPKSFDEWTRQQRGEEAWRDEEVGYNDFLSRLNQYSKTLSESQGTGYQTAEQAQKYRYDTSKALDELAQQAREYRNFFTANRDRYDEDRANRIFQSLDSGDSYLSGARENANQQEAFWKQFQSEDEYNNWNKWQEYEALRGNSDFSEKSQYKSTANNTKPSVIDILADNYRASNSGWDDPLYEFVNGNEDAGAYLYNQANSIYGSGDNALGALYGNVADSKSEARQVTDDERSMFNYIYATEGKEKAHEYYEYIKSGLNARQRQQDMEKLQQYAAEDPWGNSVLSVLESPLKGLSYVGQAADYLTSGSIDQNAGYNRFSYYGSTIRGKVADTIQKSGKWGDVGSFLYQTGMSMGDFLLNTALTGGFGVDAAANPALAKGVEALSLGIMGTGAAADATIEAKDRGLTDNQAFALGTIAGAAEIITEKVSIEALLDKTTLGRDAVGYLLKNTLSEGSEEVASDLINLVADVLISQDKSQWNEAIREYERQGYSQKDAWWRAVRDQAEEMGLDFLGGALSGGVMAGAGVAINAGINDYYARSNGQAILNADAVQATIDQGLSMNENTEAYRQARDLMARASEGQNISARQIGRLYGETVQSLDAETNAGDLLLQAAREMAKGGRISNNRAQDILNNRTALDTLLSETGVEIQEDMTRSQQRKAVKTAVEALASRNADTSVNVQENTGGSTNARQEATTVQGRGANETRNPAIQIYDGTQVAQAGEALGQNGQKALISTYAQTADTIGGKDYYEGFAQYYQAGLTGQDISQVRSQVDLTPAQQFAAYASGQNDAAINLAKEKTAASYAKTAGSDSGLVYDNFVREAIESGRSLIPGGNTYLTAETAERVNAVSKALGLRAQFAGSVEGGLANASISGSTVLIEQNNPNPVTFLFGHEITHRMQELAPNQYHSFVDFISRNDGDFQTQVEAVRDLYANSGREISYEGAVDEAAADYAGRLMEDGRLLDDFIRKNRKDRTLLEKLRDAFRSLISKLTGADKRMAQTAEGKLTAALEAAAKQAESLQTQSVDGTMSETRESLKGKYWRPDLNKAEWDLLNRHMEQEISDEAHSLDEATQWAYAVEKGNQVFAIYGVGDGTEATPLYAVGGERAAVAYELLQNWMEENDEGFDRTRKDINRIFENFKSKGGSASNSISSTTGRTAANGDVRISLEERSSNRGRNFESGTQDSGEVSKKFSLKSPVEETKDLIALHNLTEAKLLKSIALGGFPMPSIAVTRQDIPHTNFGDITLVMDKGAIDPKASRKNTVYSADAWTPTVPRVEYEADTKAEQRITTKLDQLGEKLDKHFRDSLHHVSYSMDELLNRYDGEAGVIEHAMDNYGMKAAFLEEQGQHIDPVTKQVEEDPGYSESRVEKYENVAKVLGTRDANEIGSMTMKEIRDQYGAELEQVFPGMTKSPLRMSGILNQVRAYLNAENGHVTYKTVTDTKAMERAVDAALDKPKYERWVRDLFSGLEGNNGVYNNKERFTPSGNRRSFQQTHYPATLEGITKAMAGQNGGDSRNVSGFYGVKSLRAGTAERFRDIADMHKAEGRLQNLTQVQLDKIQDNLNNRLSALTSRIIETNPIGSYMQQADAVGNILMEIAKGKLHTIDEIERVFNKEYQYHVGNELAADVRNLLFDVSQMPVNMFEAKPERAVGFDEVLAAVVPDNASEKLVEALGEKGVSVIPYEAGNDTDRIQKVNSVEGAKFSLKGTTIDKEYAALMKENQMLRERLDYWKGQTKRTQEITIDKKSVEKTAKRLLRTYESDLELSEVQGELQSIYNAIAQDREAKGNVEEIGKYWPKIKELATELIDSAVRMNTDMYDQYSDLRQYLRDQKIVYGSEYSGDIPDFNDFRKRNFGRMRLSTQGKTNIDQVYQEMSSMWPEFFNEEAQTHPTDQLLRIDEVLNSLYEIHEGNPFSQYRNEAIAGAANEILETFFELPETKKTFADKQAEKVADLRAQNRQAVKDAILAEKMAQGKEIAKLKRQYSEKSARAKETQTAREIQGKIIRHANSLSRKLLRPTDTQHIPESLRGPVAALLSSINQESKFSYDENGKRIASDSGTPTRRTEAFRALKEQYAKILAEGGDVVIDPALLGNAAEDIQGSLDSVIAMKDVPLRDLSVSQLNTMWQVLKAVETSVTTAGKTLAASKYESTQQWADAFAKDTSTLRPRSQKMRNLGLSLETPYTYFAQYGEAGRSIYRTLRNAQDQQQIIVNRVASEVQKVVDPKTVKALEKAHQSFTLSSGESLTLTTAQIMDLYNLSRREQALGHLLSGGLIQPEVKSAKVGRGTEMIRLTEGDLNTILAALTPEQRKIAEGLQKIASGTLAEYGNEASMKAYGYKKFTEANYWPIHSVAEALFSSAEKAQTNARSIRNIGMAKPLTPNASTAIELNSVFRTFADNAADMTDYAAWLCTMEDVNRLYNYKYRDEMGNRTGKTMKGILDRFGGKGAQAYWSKLMEDIQNGINTRDFEPMTNLFAKGIGSFKGAAVGGNIRVVIQQPTAFFRAAAVLNPVDMAKGLVSGVTKGDGWKKALKYSAIAMRKDAGGFDISSPYRMSETLFDTRSNVRKLNDTLSAAAGKADAVTWGALWNACEWAAVRENPNLTKGSQAFYQKTNEIFSEMIDQTQVVDGVLQRSNIMRGKSEIAKQASSFMGEPIMSLNLLVRAYDNLRSAQGGKVRSAAIKTLGRSVTALVITNAVNALAQSLVDAIRDDDPDKDYWGRFWAAFTGISGDEENTWQKIWNSIMEGNFGGNMNVLAQIPYVKDALSLAQGYEVSRMDTEVLSDVIQSAQAVIQNIDGSGKKTPGYALKELFAACAKVFGIPVANLFRDTWGAIRSVAAGTGNIPMQYEMEKAIYNITNDSNQSRFLDILYRALEQGDYDSFQHIRKDLMEQMGVDGKAIDSGLRSRYNKAVEKDPSYTISQEARDLIGSRDKLYESPEEDSFGPEDLDNKSYRSYSTQRASDYREMADSLAGIPIFKGMDPENQEKVMKAAYDLAEKTALEDNSGGQYEISAKWMQLADDAEAKGIEPWEYVLFHVAYSEMEGTKDADGNTVKGESKGDHVRQWLEDYDGFTEAQRRFLWETVYKSEW